MTTFFDKNHVELNVGDIATLTGYGKFKIVNLIKASSATYIENVADVEVIGIDKSTLSHIKIGYRIKLYVKNIIKITDDSYNRIKNIFDHNFKIRSQ